MSIDELLEIIQRTNPTMTRELLIYELSQCQYSSKALIHTEECCQKISRQNFLIPGGYAISDSENRF